MYRKTNFQTTSTVITFDVAHEEAHKDVTFELVVGQHPMALRVFLVPKNLNQQDEGGDSNNNNTGESAALTKARAQFQAFSNTGGNTAGITFYASEAAEQRICDYRHQVRVRSRSDTTRTRDPGEIFGTEPVLLLASTRSVKVYMAMTSVQPIDNVSLVCYLDPPHTTVSDEQDMFYSIWHISSTYVVSSMNQAAVVQALRTKQHLMDDASTMRHKSTGETPLHVLCRSAGDPAFAKLLLSTGWKAFGPDILDDAGESALHKLVSRPAVHDPSGPWHFRALTLLELFVKFAGASLALQSESTGDTVLHHVVRHHHYGGKLLPFVLSAGGGHATIQAMRNNKGLTAEMELSSSTSSAAAGESSEGQSEQQQQNSSSLTRLAKLTKSGKDEALKLLSACDQELQQERAKNQNRVRGLPLYSGANDSSALYTTSSLPSALKIPSPALVSSGGDDGDDGEDSSSVQRGNGFVVRRPTVKAKLAKLVFDKYDPQQTGYISRNALLTAVLSYDTIGLPESAVDRVIESLGICSDGKANLDEFSLVLLKLQNR